MALDFNLLSTTIPAEAANSAMKGMSQVNALTTQRLANQASGMEIQNALAEQEAWKGASTPQEAQQNLMRGGFGKSAMAIGKNIADVEKTQMDTIAARLPIQREMAKDMYNDPSLNNVKNTLTYQVSRGWLTPEQAQQTWQKLSTIDDNGRREYFRTSMSKADELMNTSDIKNFNYAKQTPGFVDYQRTNAKAGATTVNLPAQEKEFEKELGSGQAKSILKSREGAEDAAAILATNQIGRDILNSGAITGSGANFFVGLNSALKTAGIDAGYADAATNSQAYGATMASNVGKLIKQYGAGTGLSDADREFATKAAAGSIEMNEGAIRKVLDINDRAARNIVNKHNKNVSSIKTNIPLKVDVPSGAAPMFAVNPKTGARIQSTDNGNTWNPVGAK